MSESLARGRGSNKRTCLRCRRTVRVTRIGNDLVEADTELIAVIVETGSTERARSRAERVHAYRIHSENCERYKLEDERRAFVKAQQRRTKPTVRELAAQRKAENAAKRSGQPPPPAPWVRATAPVATVIAAPVSKYSSADEARRAVLAHYKAAEKARARL